MKVLTKILLGVLASVYTFATPAFAQSITGTLMFEALSLNFFDPAIGLVPAGYGNSAGTTVTIGNGVEFGYADPYNFDTADFTPGSLTISDIRLSGSGAAALDMSFTSSTVGFFDNATFSSNSFNGTLTVLNNTLTFSAPEFLRMDTRTAVITFAGAGAGAVAAVPEPASWALMVLGFGAAGFARRRRVRSSKVKLDGNIKQISGAAAA